MKTAYLIVFSCIVLLAFSADRALANGGDGFASVFNMFFGDEGAREKARNCGDIDHHSGQTGILGGVNAFFCHMERDMGIKGPGSATKDFGNVRVHAEVTGSAGGGAVSAGGRTYDFEGKVWVCNKSGGSACTSASQFTRAFYLAWSFKSDKVINRGYMLSDNAAFSGSSGSAMALTYDFGTSTATKTISAQVLHSGMAMRADGSKSGDTLSVTVVMATGGNNFRFSASLNQSTNAGVVYMESPSTGASAAAGTGTLSSAAASDTPVGANFTRSRSGNDWTYTLSGGTANAPTFPADSANTVAAYTVSGILGSWNSMSSTPSAL